MIKSYTFITEIKATKETYSVKNLVNNHKVNTKISYMLYKKVSNNKQYRRLYAMDNKLSLPNLSTRKIIVQYFKSRN